MRFIQVFFSMLAFAAAAWAAPPAEYQAGLDAYLNGDVRNAISLLRKSADGGHGASQALLGDILDRAEQNEEAVKYFRLAAEQAVPEGYFGLATMYGSGEGVARDLKASRQWMVKAAEAGHPNAIQAMALAYMRGGFDLTEAERKSPDAAQWIQRAAALGSLTAIDRLVVAYRQGELGLAADEKKALELEEKAKALRKADAPKTTKKKPARG